MVYTGIRSQAKSQWYQVSVFRLSQIARSSSLIGWDAWMLNFPASWLPGFIALCLNYCELATDHEQQTTDLFGE